MRKFSQEEAFPVIARLITDSCKSKQDWVTHDELVDLLMHDATGSPLVQHAHLADAEKKTKDWWAHNMIAWFSERITEEKSDYQLQFERMQIKGKYAYKPKP